MRLVHLAILTPALALSACAAHEASATSAEVDGLRAELTKLRARSAALEGRVETLENREALRSVGEAPLRNDAPRIPARPEGSLPGEVLADASADSVPTSTDAASSEPAEVPNLTVVKLSPARTPPPKIDTRTPVVEPDPGVLDALASAAPADSAALEVADAEYQNGLQSLRVGNLEGGVKALSQFAQAHPGHPLADNALYFSGIGDIGLQDWARAADAFASVIARYPAGDAVAEAMLKLADCRVHLHQREEARSLFAKVISTYPGTAAATQAEQRLASISP